MTSSRQKLAAGLSLVACLAFIPVAFAGDPPFEAWVQFGEGIPGEATDPGHEGWSKVSTFSAARDPDGFSVTCHRPLDKATPLLMGACVDGTVFPEVRIDVARYEGGTRRDFWELSLRDVVIECCDQVSESGDAGAALPPTESLTLSWKSALVTYRVFPAGSEPYPISRLVSADTDGDRLPDAYESLVGLDPLTSNVGKDSDKDGLPDIDEYRLGTDPQDATSFFLATATRTDPDNSQILLTWPSVSGDEYRIDYSPDLATPFVPHSTVTATSAETTRMIPRQLASGFFRVSHAP